MPDSVHVIELLACVFMLVIAVFTIIALEVFSHELRRFAVRSRKSDCESNRHNWGLWQNNSPTSFFQSRHCLHCNKQEQRSAI